MVFDGGLSAALPFAADFRQVLVIVFPDRRTDRPDEPRKVERAPASVRRGTGVARRVYVERPLVRLLEVEEETRDEDRREAGGRSVSVNIGRC